MKTCIFCKKEKPITEFFLRNDSKKYRNDCKDCKKSYDYDRYHNKGFKEKSRKEFIKRKYNINYEDYLKMKIDQNFECKICNKSEKKNKRPLSIDHDNKTGKIRELLCDNCNHGLGKFEDSIIILTKALNYLVKHKEEVLV